MSNSNFETQFDAIVVGTGISGGWAAKELTEKGLKTLVLERGRMVKHIEDYPTMNKDPWDFPHGDNITQEARERQPKQSRTGTQQQNQEDISLLMILITPITKINSSIGAVATTWVDALLCGEDRVTA